jgi:hypothetical protein
MKRLKEMEPAFVGLRRGKSAFAVNIFSWTKWRKTAFLQKRGIGPFFKSESSNRLQIRMIRLKSNTIGAGNFSNFWRISPGGIYTGGVEVGSLLNGAVNT